VIVAIVGIVAVGAVIAVLGLAWGLANIGLGSSKHLVGALRARAATGIEMTRLENVVDGLCVAAGLPAPELVVLDDDAPNAIVLGKRPERAVLFCTTGLLALLDRIELEGLIAHELAHLKRGDAADASWATIASGLVAGCSDSASRLVQWLIRPARESFADLGGVSLTRYPPGLLTALQKLREAPTNCPADLSITVARLTGPLWCATLAPRRRHPETAGELDLEERIGQLAEL
jgi:heat shock protein HtpX